MLEKETQESINLKNFSSADRFEQVLFQILPHGQYLVSFLPENAVKIEFIIKDAGQPEWQKVKYFFDANQMEETKIKYPISNYYHIIDNRGDLLLIFTKNITSNQYILFSAISHNYGKNWENTKQISPEHESWYPTGNILTLEKGFHAGNLVVPVFHSHINRMFTIFSNNNGKNWNFSLFIEPDGDEIEDFSEYGDEGAEGTSGTKNGKIIELSTEILVCFCINTQNSHVIMSHSSDVGHTWSDSQVIENFPIDLHYHYDIINILDKDNNKNQIILGGNIKSGDKFQAGLWKMNFQDQKFLLLWKSSKEYSKPLEFFSLTHENNELLHLMYLCPDINLVHMEFNL